MKPRETIIDIWYPEYRDKINTMDCFFSDLDCVYRGNLFAGGKAVGDFSVKDSLKVEEIASKFGITWNWGK